MPRDGYAASLKKPNGFRRHLPGIWILYAPPPIYMAAECIDY